MNMRHQVLLTEYKHHVKPRHFSWSIFRKIKLYFLNSTNIQYVDCPPFVADTWPLSTN